MLSLAVAVSAVSCLEEMEVAQPKPEGSDETILVPRVKSFTNQYITKAYAPNETKITSLALLVFNREGALVHLTETSNAAGVSSITLNKSLLNSPEQRAKLASATVVMIANVSLDNIKKSDGTTLRSNKTTLTLEEMEQFSINFEDTKTVVTSLGDGFTGFPMIGGKKGVNLNPTADQQSAIEVGLKILYAKINFSISVAEGTENKPYEGVTPQFKLNNYSVFNASMATTLAIPEEEGKPVRDFLGNVADESILGTSDEATASSSYTYTTSGAAGTASGTTTLTGNNPVNFTFYVSESRYNHNLTYDDLSSIYPADWKISASNAYEEDVKDYNPDTDADKLNGVKYFYDDLIQQYKPKLATQSPDGAPAAGMATYVILDGSYTDYRGTVWDVKYKVYLGKDNAHNFHVDRNSEYTNLITIKGIRNNDSYGDNKESVWVDHRVNVSTGDLAGNVTITRETLIDSHIEVRPLRVKWTGNEYDGVRVYLPTDSNGNLIDWIGIERYTGNNNVEASVYCYAVDESTGERIPTGKRKYFTTSLIEELQNKEGEYGVRVDEDTQKKYIYLLNNECAWIYFDENTGSAAREADINLDFYTKSGSTQTVKYKVKQRGLQTVGGYAIESYEEYLHTYDSDDKYNLSTSPVDYTQQGLAWGFVDHKLSQNTLVSTTDVPTTLLKNQMIKQYAYDYFHESDNTNSRYGYKYTKASGSWANASFGTGLTFTDVASTNRYITVKDMGTIPENAYQYCLSKNKFEADELGNVSMTINWYLPDVHEMQAILDASKSGETPVDLDSEAYYWSSQPSFSTAGTYINESTDNARAASMQEGITDRPRDNQHRIRCVYASSGIDLDEEDMEDRVPDGVGGNYVVYMKAWNNGSVGYFNYLLPPAEPGESSTEWVYNTTETNYPNKDNANSISGEKFHYIKTTDKYGNAIEGFNINPVETSSWTEYDPAIGSPDGYYTTLATYPGLTEFTLTKRTIGEAYKPSTTKKAATQTVTNGSMIVLDKKLPSAPNLNTLDHLSNGTMLNISFDQSKGTTQPAFLYDQLVSGTTATNTKYWIKPVYLGTTYDMDGLSKDDYQEGTDSGIGGSQSQYLGGSLDKAKQSAFERAYENAKIAALENLNKLTTTIYQGYTLDESSIYYSPDDLKWDSSIGVSYSNQSGNKYTGWTITCTVTLKAHGTFNENATLELFSQNPETGKWGDPVSNPTPLTPAINTDELRMYCGNSFTISLSEAAKQQGYEITKVKVHYIGGNLVDEYGTANLDKAYARFVDGEISLPTDRKTVNVIGSTETLQLSGMDYNENQNDGTGTHEWSGSGRESVTLVLADYLVATNLDGLNVVYVYQYTNTPRQPGKYIVVDQIEVKCSKRKNATFDFKQIYINSGSLETSECTVKHITVTAEGGTDETPTAITSDGLKLYSGSKVTFKALDGYVINSITGDPDLAFTGSQQIVEFSNLPEKTIAEKIVVLYSKDDSI